MCRLSEYGNCNEETVDQNYCLFHKPNKTIEEEFKFWESLKERLKPEEEEIEIHIAGRVINLRRYLFRKDVNCSGYVFPEVVEPAFFRFAVFERRAYFSGAKFSLANFFGARFSDVADFSGAEFSSADFSDAKFSLANFFGARFYEGAYFSGTEFLRADFSGAKFSLANFFGARFSDVADFSGAEFSSADFSDAKFSLANFFGARFYEGAYFSGTEFLRADFSGAKFSLAYFENARFIGEAYFSYSEFWNSVSFEKAKFLSVADFSGAKFPYLKEPSPEEILKYASFRRVHFEHPERILFDGIRGKMKISFIGTDISRIRFMNSSFDFLFDEFLLENLERIYEELEGSEEKLKHSRMLKERKLEGEKEYVTIDNVLSVIRNLRENFDYYMKYDESGKLFIREMELKRRSLWNEKERNFIVRCVEWLIYTAYKWICLYGESVVRPVLWIFSLIMIFGFLRELNITLQPINASFGDLLKGIWESLESFFQLRWDGKPLTLVERVLSLVNLGALYTSLHRKLERRIRH